MVLEVNLFLDQVVPQLKALVESDGHYLNVVHFPATNELEVFELNLFLVLF